MVWQDMFPRPGQHVDVEQERELRLAAQAAAGAEWALAALVARYQPPVTRYLTRLTGNPDLAQAEAEQIFVRMERRLHGPHGGANLRLWLLRACTEAGLNTLQQPRRPAKPQLAGPGQPIGLLPGQAGGTVEKLRAGLDTLATLTGTTTRQMRKLIWSAPDEGAAAGGRPAIPADDARMEAYGRAAAWGPSDDALDEQDPRTALRHRLVRAVLAELPYGDAQCLALHLVAGLNQREVARALGITPSAVRRRVVQGLQLFARRYEAAVASLGLTPELIQEPEQEPIAEAPESDEIMVTGEVAAVSPPLPYRPDETSLDAAPAGPSLPGTAGGADAAVRAPEDLTTMATAPLLKEPPSAVLHEVIIDAYPPARPVETVVDAYPPEAAEAIVTGSARTDEPPRASAGMAPAEPVADALPAAGPRRVPVLTQSARGGETSNAAQAETAPRVAIPGTALELAGGAARVIPVLTTQEKPAWQHSNGVESHAPGGAASLAPPGNRELASSAAMTAFGARPSADAATDD